MAEVDGSGEEWTDEKHISYLTSMEDSFVSWMLLGGRFACPGARHPPRLDRHLPDVADSTLDCRTSKRGKGRKRRRPHDGRRDYTTENLSKRSERWQRRCTTTSLPQDDQVVPEFKGIMTEGENVQPVAPAVAQAAASDDRKVQKKRMEK